MELSNLTKHFHTRIIGTPHPHPHLGCTFIWSLFIWSLLLRRGLQEAILYVLRLRPDGLLCLGPPCSSFVWVCRASSGRSAQKPYGFEHVSWVETGSLILGLCFKMDSWAEFDPLLNQISTVYSSPVVPANKRYKDSKPSSVLDDSGNRPWCLYIAGAAWIQHYAVFS